MCVNDVGEVEVAGRVVGFVSDTQVEEADPRVQLVLDAVGLQRRATNVHICL